MSTENHRGFVQEESDISRLLNLVVKNYKIYLLCLFIALTGAYLLNEYSVPVYRISASMLIKEKPVVSQNNSGNDYLNSNLFGINQKFQNELWILKSSPVLEQAITNLGLSIGYCRKEGFQQFDAYKAVPFKVMLLPNHVQPVNEWFYITLKDSSHFHLRVKSKRATFRIPDETRINYQKEEWTFEQEAKFGEIIETDDLAFVVDIDETNLQYFDTNVEYGFIFWEVSSLASNLKQQIEFTMIQRDATIVEILLRSPSVSKAEDIINELMAVYSQQNLERKNHNANITIAYIDSQLEEISDSLNETESDLQNFRSSSKLLNAASQAEEISTQYRDLQNQRAELLTRKRYYDYLDEYISKRENDYSELISPSSMGIVDELLNNLMTELITLQSQRSSLIQNRQEKNPMVQKLTLRIENIRKVISENVSAARKTSEISIDEMDKRIRRIELEIARLPRNEQLLGGIERKYRLNDAIYNYLLEKRAEAKISQASSLPDNIVIEPAKMVGTGPFFPSKRKNYFFALVLGFGIPFGILLLRTILNNRLVPQDNIGHLTDAPVLGKILHNRRKDENVMEKMPKSNIAESYRALRTNIEFYFKQVPHKTILITSSVAGEGKTFNALNLAMSYAQLNRRTILINIDLRKNTSYFSKNEKQRVGLCNYLVGTATINDVICKSSIPNLDYIISGQLPPYPLETIAQGDIPKLLTQLKELYDCIILDATPLAQVSDAYLYINEVDIVMVVARYNYTLKRVFAMIMTELKQKGIHNTCVVLNDNRSNLDQYGYGYGYNKKRGWNPLNIFRSRDIDN